MTAMHSAPLETTRSDEEGTSPQDPRPIALVVEPTLELRSRIGERLEASGFCIVEASHGLEAWPMFRRAAPDLVVAALHAPGIDGVELVRRIRRVSRVELLLHARAPEVGEAVAAVREGAGDVLGLPRELPKLEEHARRVARRRRKRPASAELSRRILGRCAAMQRVRDRVRALAELRVPVLLAGAAGTGRDHVARVLYEAGSDERGSFVKVTADRDPCATREPGRHVYYLDGIESFGAAAQARWLQLVREVRRDAARPHRILAATSVDLEGRAREGHFEPELAEEIGRFRLELPPLARRPEDVGALAQGLAARAALQMGRPAPRFSGPAIRELARRSWPGNLRDLARAVEKLVAFASQDRIGLEEVRNVLDEASSSVQSLRREREEQQRRELIALLEESGGNLAEVARRLDMSRGAIIYRAQKYGLLPRGR